LNQASTIGPPNEVGSAPIAGPGAMLRGRYETDRWPPDEHHHGYAMRSVLYQYLSSERLDLGISEVAAVFYSALAKGTRGWLRH
jgi:hypothetical protein